MTLAPRSWPSYSREETGSGSYVSGPDCTRSCPTSVRWHSRCLELYLPHLCNEDAWAPPIGNRRCKLQNRWNGEARSGPIAAQVPGRFRPQLRAGAPLRLRALVGFPRTRRRMRTKQRAQRPPAKIERQGQRLGVRRVWTGAARISETHEAPRIQTTSNVGAKLMVDLTLSPRESL
eukprot:scaffold292880_cov33-Tisochrysis_lutea.AAC.2